MSETPTGRIRRLRGRRRVDATVALAIAVPLVTALALFLARPQGWSVPAAPPATQQVDRAGMVCPAAMPGPDHLGLLSATAGGPVSVTPSGQGPARNVLRSGTPTLLRPPAGPVEVSAAGAVAGGLVTGRWSTAPLAATDCAAAEGGKWFVGLGAGPLHDSVLELTNPSDGEAVVDVDVLTEHGARDVPSLRGIAVAPHATKTFDLLDVVPQRGVLALHATVVRGQVAMSVRDQARVLTGAPAHEDWLAGQGVPKGSNLLLGVEPGAGTRVVSIANPTDRQLTASVQLVTPDSVLTPSDAPSVDVPPQTVRTLSLDKLLGEKVAADAVGVQIGAGGPIAVSMRRVTPGDVLTATSASHVHAATTTLVPPGAKRLILAGATGVGAATVVSRDAQGHQLDSTRVAVQPHQAAIVRLPDQAVSVEVTPSNVDLAGSILVEGDGATLVPLRDLVRFGRIPAVRPGLR